MIELRPAFLTGVRLSRFTETINAIGSGSGTRALDQSLASVHSATVGGATTFTFTNPPATGVAYSFTLLLTNGSAFVVTWPGAVKWPGGTAPSLTASGLDLLTFTTIDGGTTWRGALAQQDSR